MNIPGFEAPRHGMTYAGGEAGDSRDEQGAAYSQKGEEFDPYIAEGAKVIRYPIRFNRVAPGGQVDPMGDPAKPRNVSGATSPWHITHLAKRAKHAIDRGAIFMPEDHSYRSMSNPDIAIFWVKFDKAFRAECARLKYGALADSPLLIYGLQNEPDGPWATYGQDAVSRVHEIRAAGVKVTLGLGYPSWCKMAELPKALDLIQAAGGVANLDPLNRTIMCPHDYWEPSGNDQSKKIISGLDIEKRYDPAAAALRKYKITAMVEEIGLGGGTPGFLPGSKGEPDYGRKVLESFAAWTHRNSDVIRGVVAWGGRLKPTDSYHIRVGTPATNAIRDLLWKNSAAA